MISVSKEFQWAMAHMLDGHEGLCCNLHGHEYKLIVTVTNKGVNINDASRVPAPSLGMVVDFKELKGIVNSTIVNKLDHTLMLNGDTKDQFEKELTELAVKYDKKRCIVGYRPTAENMVRAFAQQLEYAFEETSIKLVKLRLYETPTSYADWEAR